MESKIYHIDTIGEWYAVFDDTDSSTDYFHSVRGSQKYIAKWVTERGDKKISVNIQNGKGVPESKTLKALNRFAKNTGYVFSVVSNKRVDSFDGTEWISYEGLLLKNGGVI